MKQILSVDCGFIILIGQDFLDKYLNDNYDFFSKVSGILRIDEYSCGSILDCLVTKGIIASINTEKCIVSLSKYDPDTDKICGSDYNDLLSKDVYKTSLLLKKLCFISLPVSPSPFRSSVKNDDELYAIIKGRFPFIKQDEFCYFKSKIVYMEMIYNSDAKNIRG